MSPLSRYALREFTGRPFRSLLLVATLSLLAFALCWLLAIVVAVVPPPAAAQPRHLVWVVGSRPDLQEEFGVMELERVPLAQVPLLTQDPAVTRFSVEDRVLVPIPRRNVEETPDYAVLRGIDPDGFALHDVELLSGRLPTAGRSEVVIGEMVHKRHPELGPGALLQIYNLYRFTVVGVYRTHNLFDEQMLTARADVGQILPYAGEAFNALYLETAAAADAERIIADVNARKGPALLARDPNRWREGMLRDQFSRLKLMMWFAFLMLTGGATFTMASALTILAMRRTTHMATLRAFGFRLPHIAALLLVETEAMAGLSAAIGIAVAAFVHRGTAFLVTGASNGALIAPTVTPPVIAAIFGLMMLLGASGCALPIIRIARLEIAESLRE